MLLPAWTQAQNPPRRWTAQGPGFSHAQRNSSLAHVPALILAGTGSSPAASELNDSGPLSRLAHFGMFWAGHLSSSSQHSKEEPEDYKLFGSAAVRDPYSSCTSVPRLTKFFFCLTMKHCWWAAFQPCLSASSNSRVLDTGWVYGRVGIQMENLLKIIMRC